MMRLIYIVTLIFILAACNVQKGGSGSVSGSSSVMLDNSVARHDNNIFENIMDIRVTEFDHNITQIQNIVNDNDGHIQSIRIYDILDIESSDNSTIKRADIDIRIPIAQHDNTKTQIEQLGEVERFTNIMRDVEVDHNIINERLQNIYAQEQDLIDMLENTENINDIIEIHKRLTDIRMDKSMLESELQNLDTNIQYARIQLGVEEIKTETINPFAGDFASRAKATFINSINMILYLISNLLVFLAAAIIPVATILISIFIASIVFKKINRK